MFQLCINSTIRSIIKIISKLLKFFFISIILLYHNLAIFNLYFASPIYHELWLKDLSIFFNFYFMQTMLESN